PTPPCSTCAAPWTPCRRCPSKATRPKGKPSGRPGPRGISDVASVCLHQRLHQLLTFLEQRCHLLAILPALVFRTFSPQVEALTRERAGCHLLTTGPHVGATGFEPATS